MGEVASLRREDGIGLAVAGAMHLGVVAILLLQPARLPDAIPDVQGIAVSLATDVSLESTAPDPVQEAAAAEAPVLGDVPVPDTLDPASQLSTIPPSARSSSSDVASTSAQRPTRRPTPSSSETASNERSGGGRIGDDFLAGQGTSSTSNETRIPANEIGASARASLQAAINRQIRPHWSAPAGLDAEQLVTIVAFRLNEDGSLAGRPRVVRQSGINDANRPQASIHADRAMRAVQRAAPFDLPDEYYEAWKNITAWRFDRRL